MGHKMCLDFLYNVCLKHSHSRRNERYMMTNIQDVTGGTDQTSGGCSLC